MTQQVLYDTTTSLVMQWQDTAQFHYAIPPSVASTLVVTAAEWSAQAGTWYVVNGELTQTNPNAPTAAQLLTQAQSAQSVTLRAACANAITGGFVSSALGTPHTYPATLTDQHNLSVSVVASLLPNLPTGWTTPFWVMADSTGAWTFAPHTAAQIQQAGLDGKTWVTTQQVQLQSLGAQITSAQTVSAVQAIVWSGASDIGGATLQATALEASHEI